MEAYAYERKLIETKASPDIEWLIKSELYFPEDESYQESNHSADEVSQPY